MTKRLFYQQSEPGSRVAATTQRLSVKARIMMALFALMLIPQVTWAQTYYPLTFNNYVGGYSNITNIDNSNENDVLGDGKVKFIYNSSDNTGRLILTGTTFNGYINSELDALTIEFSGVNIFAKTTVTGGIDASGAGHFGYIRNTKTSGSATLTVKALSSNSSIYIMNEYGDEVVGNFSSIALEDAYTATSTPFIFNSTNKRYESSDGTALQSITFTSTPTYPIWLGSVGYGFAQATDNGSSVGFSSNVTSGTASFDSSTNTLELNGATISGDIWSGLDNLIINLKGSNTLTHDGYGGAASPIFSLNNGTLTFGSDGTGNLLFSDNNGACPFTDAISGFATVTYNNGLALNTTTNTIDVTTYPLTVAGTPVTSGNQTDVFGNGTVSYAQDATGAGTLILHNAVINGTIVSGLDYLTIDVKGTNSLTGTQGYISSTNATGTLTIKKGADGSSLSLTNTTGHSAVEGFASVTLDGTYLKADNCCEYVGGSTKAYQYPATDAVGAFNVQDLEFATTHYYPLWVGSQQVSEANKGNINFLGSGKASFEHSASGINTLTLEGVGIDSSNGIESGLDNLTIVLKGFNSINTNTAYHYYPLYSNVATASLAIQKDGSTSNSSLTLTSSSKTPQVIKGFDDVDYTGLDFEVTEASGAYTKITDANVKGAVLRSLSFSGGDGTSGSPYLIATPEDLNDLATVVNSDIMDTSGKYFKVSDNIDCSGLTGFTPIAWNEDHLFKGTLDGNGKTLSNLQVDFSKYAGLFGYLSGGTINNLTLHNFTIKGDNQYMETYAGALAGMVDGTSNISNIMVTAASAGTPAVYVSTSNGANKGYAGAIFGYFKSGTLSKNCYEYTVTVKGDDAVAKTGYTPRGDGYSGVDITTSDGAVLYTQTLSTATIANGTIESWCSPTNTNTYTSNGKFVPGQTAYFKVTPATGYAIDASSPKVTYTAAGASQTINGTLETNYSSDGVNVYSFTMPDATDVTATASMLVNLSDAVYSATIDPGTYSPTGSLAPTTVKLTPKGSTSDIILNSPNDFTITAKTLGGTAAEFTNAGDYVVTIQGTGNYTGSRNVNYTINPKSVVGLEVNVSGTYTYTGSAIQPTSIEVKDGSKTLTSGTDYTIYTYSNNVDVADANDPTAPPTVTIIGMGNYDSKTTENGHFTIAQADFTTTTLLSIAAVADQTYTGSEITPTPAVTFNGTTLTAGTDFEYDYANNTDAASSSATPAPTVIVNGKGSFTGSNSVKFTINPKSIRGTTVAVSGTYTYSGTAIVPPVDNVTVTDGTKVLKNGKDYTYGCSSNTNAGTATLTVTGMGNYDTTTSENGTFTIDQATITDVEVDATEFTFAPSDTKTVTITKVSAGSLVLGTSDYSLSGTQSAIAVGSYQFTVTGTGNFQGSKNVDWKINERPASITFSSGRRYMTFYDANETFLVPNNVTAYIVTSVSGSTVTIQQVSYIPAGTPVLLESTSGTTNVKNAGDSFAGNMLSYAAANVSTNGNQYVLYSDEFVKATGTIPAGKVYLTFTSPVRRLTIDRNNSATAIEAIVEEAADGEQWYDMQGRKINKPTKDGLYIKNGKKVVVNNK